jgi:O-antigen/teichoic acid export membrane protein
MVSNPPTMLKRIAHAFVAFFFGHGIGVVASLLLVPLYLHVWSPTLYGEWLALYSVVGYLSSLDLGVQTYAVNRLTQAYAQDDVQEYRRVQHTAFAFYFCLALLGSVALIAFGLWAPIRSWFHVSITDQHSTFLIVLLLGGQFLWTIPASLVWSVYTTAGNLAKTQWVMNASSTLSVALTAGALLFWPRLAVVAAAQAAGFVFILTVVFWDIHKRYPQLAPGFSHARVSLLRPILKQSVFFALIDLAVAATLQGSNLIVAGFAGTAALAVFVTTRTLANSIRQLVGLFVHSSSTNLTVLETLPDKQKLRLAFRLVVFATVAGCVAVSASLWFEGPSVFSVWTRGRLPMDTWLLRMFLLWLVLQSPWIAASAIQSYSNKHRGLAMSYLASSFGGLLLGVALVPRLGMKGLPIAFVVAEAAACYHFVMRDACRITGEPYLRFASKLWLGITVVGGSAFCAAWAVHLAPGLGVFPRWIFSGCASIAAVALSTWAFWFREEERTFVRRKTGSGLRMIERTLPLRATNS